MNEEQKSPRPTPFAAKKGHSFSCREVEITSVRIRLRPISEQYAEDIFRHFTAEVTRYMYPKPPDRIEETRQFIGHSLAGMQREDTLQFVIIDARSGEFLGCCGLDGRDQPRTPELGIWLKMDAHGHGYGREAIAALKQWADRHLQYDYLTYPVDRANIASRKIPEGLGGQIFREEKYRTKDGRILDLVDYKILPPQ